MKTFVAVAGLLFLSFCIEAQSLSDIAGIWRGDKALGDVMVNADGSGIIVFEGNPKLSMKIAVAIENGAFKISQNEPNNFEFYLAFNPYLAKKLVYEQALTLAEKARPMVWEMKLGSKDMLSGTKYTSAFSVSDKGEMKIDNEYKRASSWTRLSGRLDPPTGTVKKGDAGQTVVLSHTDIKVQIWYTLDGSSPIPEKSLKYSGNLAFKTSATIQAMAVKDSFMASEVFTLPVLVQNDVKAQVTMERDNWQLDILSVTYVAANLIEISMRALNKASEARSFYVTDRYSNIYVAGSSIEGNKALSAGKEPGTMLAWTVPPKIAVVFKIQFSAQPGIAALEAFDFNQGFAYFGTLRVTLP